MIKVHELSNYVREHINKINGFISCGKEHFITRGCYDYAETKLVIKF